MNNKQIAEEVLKGCGKDLGAYMYVPEEYDQCTDAIRHRHSKEINCICGIDELGNLELCTSCISYAKGLLTAWKKQVEDYQEMLKWKTRKLLNGNIPTQRLIDFREGYDSAYEIWENKIKEKIQDLTESIAKLEDGLK